MFVYSSIQFSHSFSSLSASDLDPLQAPMWTVRVLMVDNPQVLLGEC